MTIPPRESVSVEFKSDVKRLGDDVILDTVVALANTDGGALYLGVEDDGTPTGVHKTHRDVARLAAFIANKTVPPVSVRVSPEIITDGDGDGEAMVIAIGVPKSPAVVATASGKMLRRRVKFDGTPESVPMYPHEIVSRLSELRSYDYSAIAAPGATVEDFDPIEMRRMQERLRSSSKVDNVLLGLSDDELARALSLVTTDGGATVPTIAGILLLGKREAIRRIVPTHGGSFQVVEGAGLRVDRDYCGPILSTIEDMESMLSGWNPGTELFDGFYRISIPEFSVDAVREGIVNAFGHRDYAVLGQVRVQVDERGLSVTSPGGFIDGVTSANLLTVDPRGRNLCLMDALKRIGMAERTGRGVDRIYEGSLLFGKHVPEWSESSGAHVRLFIPRGNPDEGFMRMLDEARRRLGTMPSVWSMLVLDALRTQGPLTARKLGEVIHMSQGEAEVTLEGLLTIGLVRKKSYSGARRFFLNEEVYGRRYDHPGIVRTRIESAEYPESVYDYVLRNGSVSTGEVMSMLDVNAKQAYRILVSLVDDGRLVRSGRGAATRYVLSDVNVG